MTTITEFDIDELVVQLHEELKLAFHLAQVDKLGDRFQLEFVKARMGRKDLERPREDSAYNLLKPDRYPNEEDWEIEVSYSNRNHTLKEKKSATPLRGEYMLFDNLKDLPLSSLKGISEYWQSVFMEVNIQTLGELISMPEGLVYALCKTHNSFLPQEFKTKASFLKQPITLIEKLNVEQMCLKDVALCSEKELKTIFGNRLTNLEIRLIQNTANLLMLVLDKDVFLKLSLKSIFCKKGNA